MTTLCCGNLSAQTLVINEIMQSNVETIMDDITEFPDSWVELYNPTDAAINLKDYKISNKDKEKKAWQLPDMEVPAGGHVIIYCDKEGKEDNRLHANFRLESGKDGNLYLFTGGEIVDKLEKLAKMPAPDVAYGRTTDGGEEWGYELQVTPGAANEGGVVDADHLLGAPEFSQNGQVFENGSSFQLTLSLPEGAPEGTVIRYTTNGSEPTATSTLYSDPINISKTKVIRAKLFCEGYLSPVSTAQSYIFHPRAFTLPIFSVQMDDRYLNDKEIGLFANNNSKEDKKLHDWRRPMNIEFFPAAGAESAFNQLGETRIQGGQSRGNALKSMVFYANKRFDPDHKQYQYEFFPDQKPGIKKFKSFSLRDGGNDFGDLYFRDLIIQRTMAGNVDLDWQAGHSAVLYINGDYMGMLNIRERSNEDNIYSNYDGLEDIDLIEISHENQGGDLFIEEFKEGDDVFYNNFKNFYSEKGHKLAEYEEWMDVSEYLNVIVMNFFYGNIDFPGNNLVFWRPNDDDTESGLPKKWRVIVKDTDFGLGLYGRTADVYNMIDMLYHPASHQEFAWAFTEPATRLLKNMLEDPDILNMFIDKCCVYMGDFMNAEGTGKIIDLIQAEVLDEFVAHRAKYPSWGGNSREEIINKFNDAKKWLAGYTEQGWWGQTTTYKPRTEYFMEQLNNQYNLGTPVALTINKESNEDLEITVNGIKLTNKVFDGQYFTGRNITLSAAVKGWKVTGVVNQDYEGGEVTIKMPAGKIAINPIIDNGDDPGQGGDDPGQGGEGDGIKTVDYSIIDNAPVYDLLGNKVTTLQSGRLYIVNGKKVMIK